MDELGVAGWLGLTPQQYELLLAVKNLQLRGTNPTPKSIVDEYLRFYGRRISRPNLFNQLNPLIKGGFVVKVAPGVYELDMQSIKGFLAERTKEGEKRLRLMRRFSENVDKELEKLSSKSGKPIVEYIPPSQLFTRIAESLLKAKNWYADSPFPNIAYPYALARKIARTDFVEAQWLKAFKERTLDIYYLTDLRIDFVFFRAQKAFGKRSRALRECQIALERAGEICELYDNLHMRYMEPLPGPHMYVYEYEAGRPEELYLCLRGASVGPKEYLEHKDPYGGVRIISEDIATQALETYTASFKHAVPLRGRFLDGKLKEKRELLDRTARNG